MSFEQPGPQPPYGQPPYGAQPFPPGAGAPPYPGAPYGGLPAGPPPAPPRAPGVFGLLGIGFREVFGRFLTLLWFPVLAIVLPSALVWLLIGPQALVPTGAEPLAVTLDLMLINLASLVILAFLLLVATRQIMTRRLALDGGDLGRVGRILWAWILFIAVPYAVLVGGGIYAGFFIDNQWAAIGLGVLGFIIAIIIALRMSFYVPGLAALDDPGMFRSFGQTGRYWGRLLGLWILVLILLIVFFIVIGIVVSIAFGGALATVGATSMPEQFVAMFAGPFAAAAIAGQVIITVITVYIGMVPVAAAAYLYAQYVRPQAAAGGR